MSHQNLGSLWSLFLFSRHLHLRLAARALPGDAGSERSSTQRSKGTLQHTERQRTHTWLRGSRKPREGAPRSIPGPGSAASCHLVTQQREVTVGCREASVAHAPPTVTALPTLNRETGSDEKKNFISIKLRSRNQSLSQVTKIVNHTVNKMQRAQDTGQRAQDG